MKCAKCGAELKVGCIYCSVCGQEAQIVPDYNLLEDDLLGELLKEKKKEAPSGKKEDPGKKSPKKKKRKKTGLIVGGSIAAIAVMILLVTLLVHHSHSQSYEYQMDQAEECISNQKYDKAKTYLERAAELEESGVEAKLKLAKVYQKQEAYDDAVTLLKELIGEDGGKEAYEELIAVYAEQKEYKAISELAEEADDPKILKLFSDYLVEAPVFGEKPGKYADELSLEISGPDNCKIYYTMDGSEPEQGMLYTGPVAIGEGDMVLRAVSCNELGIYSEETMGNYKVEFETPDVPVVTPDGGQFHAPQQISVDVPEGCRVYYTWDGDIKNAAEYESPIDVPEGNNILSVFLVDAHGMNSDVLKCNYVYIP